MQGRKDFEAKLFSQFSLEERVRQDHLLRQVAAAVDLSFVRRLTARFYSSTGQPGVDPVVLFKLALPGYLYGITSERRVAAEARVNLAFMWFLGYDLDELAPDHSVLSKARKRFGLPVFQAFFTEIVRQCEAAGLVQGTRLYADSTLVEANASMESRVSRPLVGELTTAQEHLDALWRENPAADDGEPANVPAVPEASSVPPAPPSSSVEPAGGVHLLRPGVDPSNPRKEPAHVLVMSRTDPDAELVGRSGVPLRFYHKVHVGVDGGRARIITAVDATPGGIGEEQLLGRLLQEHAGTTGRTVKEVVADSKYGTFFNYAALDARGIEATIPLPRTTAERRPYPPVWVRRGGGPVRVSSGSGAASPRL